MSDLPIIVRRQERHGTTAQWAAAAIPPALAEVCVEHDVAGVTLGVRVGDGVSLFPALPNIGAPPPLRDTLATLVATNPVPAVGRLVIATDSSPQIFAIGNGTLAWSALPKFEERTAPVRASTTILNVTAAGSTAYVDRTGLTVTFTVGAVPWVVEARESHVYSANPAGNPVLALRDAANVVTATTMGVLNATPNGTLHFGYVGPVTERITAPGTYTRKVSFQNQYAAAGATLVFGANLAQYAAYILARPER